MRISSFRSSTKTLVMERNGQDERGLAFRGFSEMDKVPHSRALTDKL